MKDDILPYLNTIRHMDAIEMLKTLPDESVDLVFTDPPYVISTPKRIHRDYRSGKNGDVSFDFGDWDYSYDPIPFLEEAKRVINPHGGIIVFMAEQQFGTYREWMAEHMFPRQLLVWAKLNPIPSFTKIGYRQATELLYWATKTKGIKRVNPNFNFTTQEEMRNILVSGICQGNERVKFPKKHPTQKPLKICRQIINVHCRPGGVVVDPYSGVGSISVAAKELGRHYIGSDLDEVYVQISKERLANVSIG